jgi:hypothetical protein
MTRNLPRPVADRAGHQISNPVGATGSMSVLPDKLGSQTGRRSMRGQANAGKALMDVRRLAALDMHGRRGSKRRRRLILAEFVLAAIDVSLLGMTILLRAASAPLALLGAYLVGVSLNYVPLALHAIFLSRADRLDAELADVDVKAELRHYTAKQLFIGIPVLVLILGTAQAAANRRGRSESRTFAQC